MIPTGLTNVSNTTPAKVAVVGGNCQIYLNNKTKGKKMNNTENAIDALKLANQLFGDMFGIDESEDDK